MSRSGWVIPRATHRPINRGMAGPREPTRPPSRAWPGASGASGAASPVAVLERVADAVHRSDEARFGAVLAELAPDPGDVRVHDAPTRVVAVAPHAVHQLLPREPP